MTSSGRGYVRWPAGTVALILAVFVPCLLSALAWVGRPFAGFLVLQNGTVVSIGRAEWMPRTHRSAQWTRVIAVDGRPVAGGAEVISHIETKGIGKTVAYTFRRGTDMFRLALEVRPFGWTDFAEMLAPLLGVGLVLALAGAAILARQPEAPQAQALFAVCLGIGLMLMTGPDQYSPYRFSPLFFLSLSLIPPAILHFDLTYPQHSPMLRYGKRLYVPLYLSFAALGLGLGLLASSSEPALFLALLYTVYLLMVNAVLLGVGGIVLAMTRGVRPLAPLALVLAAVLGSTLPIGILISYPLLERPVSPVWLVGPLLLIPALIGTAFLRFPLPTAPDLETVS